MLHLYRRHYDTCKHQKRVKTFTKCDCPVWVVGHRNNRPVRQSMQTRNWNAAEREIERWLGEDFRARIGGAAAAQSQGEEKRSAADAALKKNISVAGAVAKYLDKLRLKK